MREGKKPAGCWKCFNDEDLGKKSMQFQSKKTFIAWNDEEDQSTPYEHKSHDSGVMKGLS